jgi:hypothetical protein
VKRYRCPPPKTDLGELTDGGDHKRIEQHVREFDVQPLRGDKAPRFGSGKITAFQGPKRHQIL